jgi:ComF family protein
VASYALLQKSKQFLYDLLYPPRCVSCRSAQGWFCQTCVSKISLIAPPICRRCGSPVSTNSAPRCPECKSNPLQFIDSIRSASFFEDNPIRPAIHFLKYRNYQAVAEILGQILVNAYRIHHLEAGVIIPVPLHPARLKERGYNQSELLAREMARILGVPVNTTSLQRVRKTKTQMQLGVLERRQNVLDAFACHQHDLAGQKALLIDDVCTTGSTLDACAAALKRAGAETVSGLTLSRARFKS